MGCMRPDRERPLWLRHFAAAPPHASRRAAADDRDLNMFKLRAKVRRGFLSPLVTHAACGTR